MARKPTPQEPPLVIRIRGAVGPVRGLMDRDLRRILSEPPSGEHFEELLKTAFERLAVRESVRGLNVFRDDFGLPPLDIPTRRAHVMSGEAFRAYFSPKRKAKRLPLGITSQPHAYIQRIDDRGALVGVVSHEVVHLSAFAMFIIQAEVDVGGKVVVGKARVLNRIGGIRRGRKGFVGLNEAMTEIIAEQVRKRMLRPQSKMPQRLVLHVLEYGSYASQIAVLDRIMKEVFGNADFGYSLAVWDYFTGTSDFLREVKRRRPEFVGPLRTMGETDHSALKTARALGFKEEAREIRQGMRKPKK